MRALNGQCYEIREALKALKCVFDGEQECWFAPADVHGEAQALADVENRRLWLEYLGTLVWCDGEFTETVWKAGMRAASLFIPFVEAWHEIARRVREGKSVPDRWFDRNIRRAYEAAGVAGNDGKQQMADGKWREAGKRMEAREPAKFRPRTLWGVASGAREEIHLGWLADRSPVDPFTVTSEAFLSALYEPGDRVVVFDTFASQGQWIWNAEEGFVSSNVLTAALYDRANVPMERGGRPFDGIGPQGIWYFCNPVSGDWRWMEEGAGEDHWSRRFHECVRRWRYLVLESDKAAGLPWVSMAVQLPLRIAAIYTSGSKSVHVLVRVDAKSKREWDEWRDEIKPIMVTLGADAGCMTAVRLTRLPGCTRMLDKEGRSWPNGPRAQKLLYLNPSPDMTPIQSKPPVRDAVGPWLRLAESLMSTPGEELDPEQVERCRRGLDFYATVPGVAPLRRALRNG